MSTIVITQDHGSIERAIERALAPLRLPDLVTDREVAIKPNDTWASPDDRSGVTQPDSLRAVVRAVRAAGAAHIVVTGGAGAAETDDVFRHAGLMEVVETEDVEFVDHNRPPFTEVELDYSPARDVEGPQRSVMVNARVLEYDVLVALNQLKMHETATVTLGLKNVAMSYPAADYYGHPRSSERRHENAFFDDMHSFIAAMARRFPIDLSVTLGQPAMVATGPLGGHAVETGLAIAGRDALAVDVVGARLLGFNPQAVRHLWEAERLELGETRLSEMEFPEMSLQSAIGEFTEAVYGERLSYRHA